MLKRAVCLAALCGSCHAQTTIGLHVATAHFSSGSHNDNPGLYVTLPFGLAGGRVMFGGYRNSLTTPERRTSYYIAQAWDFGRYSAVLGVVSGYQRSREPCECPLELRNRYTTCTGEWGHTRGALGPMGALSVAWPEAQPFVGVTPRLSLMPKGVHFSIERTL